MVNECAWAVQCKMGTWTFPTGFLCAMYWVNRSLLLTYACYTASCEGDEAAQTEHKQDEGRGQVWVAPRGGIYRLERHGCQTRNSPRWYTQESKAPSSTNRPTASFITDGRLRLGPCLSAWGAEHSLKNSLMRGLSPSAGMYDYLCPVPGHAADGMHGRLVVP